MMTGDQGQPVLSLASYHDAIAASHQFASALPQPAGASALLVVPHQHSVPSTRAARIFFGVSLAPPAGASASAFYSPGTQHG